MITYFPMPAAEDLTTLSAELEQVTHQRDEYKKLYEAVLVELQLLRRRIFGQKREYVDPNQSQLAFLEYAKAITALCETEAGTEESKETGSRQKRVRRGHGRQQLPEDLPEERIDLPPRAEVDVSDDRWQKIGEETSERVEWRKGSYVRLKMVRPRYAKKGEPENGVVIAPMPTMPIEKSIAGPGMLAHVLVSKYADHIPLYRQVKIMAREGLDFSRSTLCGWVEACHRLAKPVVDAMWKEALGSDYLAVDATGVLVQAPKKCRRGAFWVVVAPKQHVLFRYTRRQTKKSVEEILGGFEGFLQADAATVYDFLYGPDSLAEKIPDTPKGCIEVGCWAHMRRLVFNALITDRERALVGLGFIRELYKIDKPLWELPAKKRKKARIETMEPVVDAYFEWVDKMLLEVLPESPIGKAMKYAKNQRLALRRFLEDPRLKLDNNMSERELRREAVGRKNWIFCGSDDGADWNTTFVSLIASCEMHGIEPWAYLRDILLLLPDWSKKRTLELSPRYWKATRDGEEATRLLESNPVWQVTARKTEEDQED